MAIILPNRTDLPHYSFQIDLEGVTYEMEFRWNERDLAWFASLYDGEADPISVGKKVVLHFPLFARCKDSRKPPGVFIAEDTTGADLAPGLTDLGDRVQILYLENDELPEE